MAIGKVIGVTKKILKSSVFQLSHGTKTFIEASHTNNIDT